MDVLVSRKDSKVITDWYQKPTWSGRYLNYDSYLPNSYKINTIDLLTRKVLELADESYRQKNFDKIVDTLMNNNYPPTLVHKVMESTIQKFHSAGPRNQENIENKFISLPYCSVSFNKLKELLGGFGISVVGKPLQTVGNLFFSNLKDKIPKEFKSNVVYSVVCTCGEQYIGNTGQWLKNRFQQHKSRDEHHSALSEHLYNTNHSNYLRRDENYL